MIRFGRLTQRINNKLEKYSRKHRSRRRSRFPVSSPCVSYIESKSDETYCIGLRQTPLAKKNNISPPPPHWCSVSKGMRGQWLNDLRQATNEYPPPPRDHHHQHHPMIPPARCHCSNLATRLATSCLLLCPCSRQRMTPVCCSDSCACAGGTGDAVLQLYSVLCAAVQATEPTDHVSGFAYHSEAR